MTNTATPAPTPTSTGTRPGRGTPPVVEALALCVAARVPVLLWGDPGVGKTATVQAIADRLAGDDPGFVFETIIASLHEPADFGGYPVADLDTGTARHLAPEWAARLAQRRGLLFLDEFSTAPPAVQAACLRLLAERVIGGTDLGPDVSIVLAANPVTSAAAGWDLSPAVSRRFVHLHFDTVVDEIVHGITHGFTPPEIPDLSGVQESCATPAGTATRRTVRTDPEVRATVAAFLDAHRGAVIDVPADGAAASAAWANPAAWDRLTVLLSAAEAAGISEDARRLLVEGCVGTAHGIEFLQFSRYRDLPSAEELLADASMLDVSALRADQLHIVLTSIRIAVGDRPSAPRWAAAWRVAARACDASEGAATALARWLAVNRPDDADPTIPEIRTFLPILAEAGLLRAAA